MKILVRLPNWLGDVVMSTAFLRTLRSVWPEAAIDVIIKKGLDSLADLVPGINRHYVFDRDEWKGLKGAYRFGKKIKKETRYDMFFCLPDSFSSAVMGWASGAKKRIGFKKELRSFLLTHSFTKPTPLHRAEEYVFLLRKFIKQDIPVPGVKLEPRAPLIPGQVILNFNSEAISRRMPVHKAVTVLNALVNQIPGAGFVCIGSKKDRDHIGNILTQSGLSERVINKAGMTPGLPDLIALIGSGAVMLSTDSGPAHIANALGVPLVVLFGAGNENNTAPFNKENRVILRLGQLPCEPCVKNTCIYGLPKCLELLDEQLIVKAVQGFLGYTSV